MKDDMIQVEGVVTEVLPNTTFKVRINNTRDIMCHLSGKLRTNYIRITRDDSVRVELSPYDLTKGRIVWRNR